MWYLASGLIIASGLWAMAQAIANVVKAMERSNRLKAAELKASGIDVDAELGGHTADVAPHAASAGTRSAGLSDAALASGGSSASSGR